MTRRRMSDIAGAGLAASALAGTAMTGAFRRDVLTAAAIRFR